jgi:hypothetical protein
MNRVVPIPGGLSLSARIETPLAFDSIGGIVDEKRFIIDLLE